MKEITLEAKVDNLNNVMVFIDEELESAGCTMKAQMQIDVAVEELFVNIASYAYGDGTGNATIIADVDGAASKATITFIDEGVPYDPLAKDDPDVTLSAAERQIGGLGIFIVKKSMDDVIYKYEDGKNILTIVSSWG
ncbi:ATP-binding protein [Butyrivibrio sp. VCD2006]|uniref:ATP-binding protein n=1 Tax=Butyrivibrio sp. VCD2006 TaxID=1280664 RepID=UPI00040A1236|nr:ATP-binding protein [Butyrivibrio sp. VCD2006]